MARYWIHGSECHIEPGETGYLVEISPQHGKARCVVYQQPGRTNLSHEPRTHGWLGTTDNVARFALGMCRAIRSATNGRVLVETIEGNAT